MLRLSLVLIALLATVNRIHGLSCRTCVPEECVDPPNCKYGFVTGVCGCCNVCAKGPGEECGGTWGLLGRCAKGYTCDTSKKEGEGDFLQPFPEGVCVADQKPPEALSAPLSLISRPTGGSGASGLLGGVRAGQAKKLAQKHKHQDYGSAIPPEYLALLRQKSQGRGKRSLNGGLRRAGTSKLTATKHSHTAFGGIPEEYLELLRQYSKSYRVKRALSGGMRRVGTAKLTATKHSHSAFGGIPDEYKELLKLYRQARVKRSLGGHRRAGSAKLTATKHSHIAASGIPPEFAALLQEYRSNKQG